MVVRYIKPKTKKMKEKEIIGLQGNDKTKNTPRWWMKIKNKTHGSPLYKKERNENKGIERKY